MSLSLKLPETVGFIKSTLQNKYHDEFKQHSSLNTQLEERLRDWQHETRLSLLQQKPFELYEQQLARQNQLFQNQETVFEQTYLSEYQQFCHQNGLPFDKQFWHNELNRKKQKGKANPKRTAWRLMLDQWQKQLDQAQAEWYLQQLNALRQKFLTELEQWLELIKKLGQQLNQLGLEAGLWLDNSLGKLTPQSIEELKRWLNYLANDKAAKEIAELLGKMRQIEQASKIEKVQQTISIQTPVIDVNSREEIIGVRLGKDLEYVLPSELALLSDKETEILFDLKFLESKLMCFELQGLDYREDTTEIMVEQEISEDDKLGPIILCVDTSASMQGTPEHIAKAMALYLGSQAKSQKRSCFVINFSTRIDTFEINEQSGMSDLIGFLRKSFHGGTDVAPALRYALKLLQQERYEKADVLLISDFVMGGLPQDVLDAIQTQREAKNKFNSLVIGNAFMSERLKTHFDHEWIYNPYSKNIQELVQFKQEWLNR